MTEEAIADDYIENSNKYVSELLEVSNNTIVFDLIRHSNEESKNYTSEVN